MNPLVAGAPPSSLCGRPPPDEAAPFANLLSQVEWCDPVLVGMLGEQETFLQILCGSGETPARPAVIFGR